MTILDQRPASTPAPFDEAKLHAFIGKAIDDWGAIGSGPLILIGDELGLYDAMAAHGAVTSSELAQQTQTSERYVREWLLNQAAGGIVTYEPTTSRYSLPAEHAAALPNLVGGYQLFVTATRDQARIAEAFRTGGGMLWGEHEDGVFQGTERFFRPAYEANLVSAWIPSLTGVVAKLEAGATVADVGCGYGASTIVMARAYPNSRFVGFDIHAPSIEWARLAAEAAGVSERASFEVISAGAYPAPLNGYDLIAFFDCLHDMSNPTEAAQRAYAALAPDGTLMIVEPMAGQHVEDNLHPLGRAFTAASTLLCTPHARAAGGDGLGSQATDQQLKDVMFAGGFSCFKRATETPFNRIFEARR